MSDVDWTADRARRRWAWFERISAGAVVASLIEFTISTMSLSATVRLVCDTASVSLRWFFAVEFLDRLAAAERRLRYVGSVVGLLDLGAVVLDFGALKLLRRNRTAPKASAIHAFLRSARAPGVFQATALQPRGVQ